MSSILPMGKERVHKLFAEYFNNEPLIHVWEIGSELVFGSRDEVGYKMLTEADPLPLLNGARTDPKAFELNIHDFEPKLIETYRNCKLKLLCIEQFTIRADEPPARYLPLRDISSPGIIDVSLIIGRLEKKCQNNMIIYCPIAIMK